MDKYYAIDDIPRNETLAIYGCGDFGRTLREAIESTRQDVRVAFFVDSTSAGEQGGLEIVTRASLAAGRIHDVDHVVIASHFWEEIVSDLDETVLGRIVVADKEIVKSYRIELGLEPRFPAISIELSSACDMDCDFCMHRIMPDRSRHMDKELLMKLLADIRDNNLSEEVAFVGFGETLLYPHLDEALRTCRDLGLKSSICTNGLRLTPKRYEDLVMSGLDGDMYLSLQNLSHEGFVHRNPKKAMTFAQFYQQVLGCIEVHMSKGFKNMLTIPLLIAHENCAVADLWGLPGLIDETKDHERRFLAFSDDIKAMARKYSFSLDIDMEEYRKGVAVVHGNQLGGQTLDIAETMRLFLMPLVHRTPSVMTKMCADRIDEYEYIPGTNGICPSMGAPQVTWTGDMLPCCWIPCDKDEYSALAMGNIQMEPIMDIVHLKRWLRFFSMGKRGILPSKVCRGCMGQYSKKEQVRR